MLQFVAMFWKELIQVANRRRFVAAKSVLVLVISVCFVLLAYSVVYTDRGDSLYAEMSSFGRGFFLFSMALLTVVLSVYAMTVASGIVASETARRRMPLLLVSPLGSGAIVGSKALAVFSQVAIGFLIALPVFALLQMFGGVDSKMVLTAAAFLVSNVWFYGSIGLLASVLTTNIIWAVSLAGLAMFLWNLLPFILWIFFYNAFNLKTPPWYFGYLSPFYTYVSFSVARVAAGDLAYHFGVNFFAGLLLTSLAFAAFRPIVTRRLAGPPGASKRRARRATPGGTPKRQRRSALRALAGRLEPGILSKELVSSRLSRVLLPFFWFAIPWGILFIVSFSTGEWPDFADKELASALFFTEAVGFLFLLAIFASTRFAAEKEAATLQNLALTRLSALRILAGKGVALLVEQAAPITLLSLHLLLALHLAAGERWASCLAGFVASLGLAVTFGLYFSLACRRIVEAVVATAIAWAVGAYAILFPLALLAEHYRVGADTQQFAAFISAPFCVIWLIFVLVRARKRGFGSLLAFLSYALLSAAIYATVWSARQHVAIGSLMFTMSPMAALFPGEWTEKGVPAILYVLSIQTVVFVWMILASLANFEQQARRSA